MGISPSKDTIRSLASIQEITKIEDINNSTNLAVAQVLGWQVVIKRNEFQVGQKIVYFEIDSILPNLFHDKWKKMSFLEVKLGKKTYNRNDENEKKNEKKDQMSTSSTLGFRITNAFIIKKNSEAIKIKKGEAFSHLSKKENSEQLIKDFIFEESGNEEDRKQAGKYFLQGFEKMVTWFKGNQSSEKFISVSLMFFLHYEEKFWDLKLVDFASKHKEEKETKDNLIDGLRNLYKIFKELLD